MDNNPTLKNKSRRSPEDFYIAKKLRERRTELGLNQSDLANTLGITAQQLSKYEKGLDRISASRLFEFARVLSLPVSFFNEKEAEEEHPYSMEKGLVITCTNLQGRKVRIKSLKLKVILTDTTTNEDYELEIS